MKCKKIEAHIIRTNENDKINKTIVAFNQRYHLVSVTISGFGWGQCVAVYEPESSMLEDK
jgi:hypothetical protein